MKILSYLLAALLVQKVAITAFASEAEEDFTVPVRESSTYNLNIDWKYKRPSSAWPLARR